MVSRFILKLTIGVLVVAGIASVSAPLWLPVVGRALVVDDGPAKADLAVVLGGDLSGGRIAAAGELIRKGYVPAALISGPDGLYDRHESDFEIAYAVRLGYPAKWFIPLPHEAHSTRDEAVVVLKDLHRRGVHSILLVTSDFHTRRAARIFRAAERAQDADIAIRSVAVHGKAFQPDSWWKSREGREVAFLEWTKTISGAFGL